MRCSNTEAGIAHLVQCISYKLDDRGIWFRVCRASRPAVGLS